MKAYVRQYLFLVLGGLTIVSGIAYSVTDFIRHNPFKDRIPLEAPGISQLALEPGRYGIFHEYSLREYDLGALEVTTTNGQATDWQLDGLAIHIVKSGYSIPVRMKPDTGTTFSVNGKKAQSLYRMTVYEGGVYDVEVETAENAPIRLSLVRDLDGRLLKDLKLAGFAVAGSVPLLLAGWFFYSREERRKRPAFAQKRRKGR